MVILESDYEKALESVREETIKEFTGKAMKGFALFMKKHCKANHKCGNLCGIKKCVAYCIFEDSLKDK